MRIYVFDSWKVKGTGESKFLQPVIDHWRELGHEVQTGIWWGPDLVKWAEGGLCMFFPVDNNLKRASLETPKPANTRIIAEAVDADIYGGQWKGVNWAWVDGLVCMSRHMLDYMRRNGLPDSVPVHLVPGGVDLSKWTMRRDQRRGYNVAWIGHYWIAKNLFGALQVFNELIRRDPASPWRLFVRADERWSPNWWEEHCKAYLAANPQLAERVTFITQRIADLNEWLEDKSYILSTSFKEAYGYAVGEAAAKGIMPIIQNTNGALDIWPREWVFDVHSQAVDRFLNGWYEPELYRNYVAQRYPLEKRLAALDRICFQTGEEDLIPHFDAALREMEEEGYK